MSDNSFFIQYFISNNYVLLPAPVNKNKQKYGIWIIRLMKGQEKHVHHLITNKAIKRFGNSGRLKNI